MRWCDLNLPQNKHFDLLRDSITFWSGLLGSHYLGFTDQVMLVYTFGMVLVTYQFQVLHGYLLLG